VKISAAESYGLPSLVAESELTKFCNDAVLKIQCTEAEARKQMSIVVGEKIFDQVEDPKTKKPKPRYSLEIALISRVFLTRWMQTTIRRSGSAGGAASVGQKPEVPDTVDDTVSKSGAAVKGTQAVRPEVAVPIPKAPGVTTSLEFGNSSVISTVDVLQRPVAFGYRSVRWIPGD
jgi:hypothetical protein